MPAPRKYTTEIALNLYSSGPTLIQPSDLENIQNEPEETQKILQNCKIYLITRRPRVSLVPSSVAIGKNLLTGEIDIHTNEGLVRKPFSIKRKIDPSIARVDASEYPHARMRFFDKDNEVIVGFPMLFVQGDMECDYPGLDELEVLYVGQAFGAEGKRSAVDRLSSHSTLQKILADVAAKSPNYEVWLVLYQFEYSQYYLNMNGTVVPTMDNDADTEHYMEVLKAKIKRSSEIALAEAGLIRYFDPPYNKVFTKSFPKRSQKLLKKVYKLDLAGLIVEVNIEDIGLRLFSENAASNFHHIARFDLHSPKERESMFFGPKI